MTQADYLKTLLHRISDDEWDKLAAVPPMLPINDFNRRTLLRLKNFQAGNGMVDTEKAQELETLLTEYLKKYLPDRDAHKWIILSCLGLTFILGEPMHPPERVGIVKDTGTDPIQYRCPMRDTAEGSICRYCVCQYLTP